MSRRLADLWLMPHRPFLLAAGTWAMLAILWWQWGLAAGFGPPALGTPALWHAHEMIFGFAGAAAAAYLLTALMSWCASPPLSGLPLRAAVALWLLQRVTMVLAGVLPVWVVVLPGIAFFGFLTALLATALIRARAWSKGIFPVMTALLGLLDLLFILAALGDDGAAGARLGRAGVLAFAFLVTLIGGRMLPAFAGNWLKQRGEANTPAGSPLAEALSLALIALAGGLLVAGSERAAGLALGLGALVQAGRMVHWSRRRALANPLLLLMFAAYAWLPLGMALTGAVWAGIGIMPESDALHALTMGVIGGMILAVAARAAARREGGVLVAGTLLKVAGIVLWLSVWLRLAGAFRAGLTELAATCWVLAWALFVASLVPSLLGPVVRPVFSGSRG